MIVYWNETPQLYNKIVGKVGLGILFLSVKIYLYRYHSKIIINIYFRKIWYELNKTEDNE